MLAEKGGGGDRNKTGKRVLLINYTSLTWIFLDSSEVIRTGVSWTVQPCIPALNGFLFKMFKAKKTGGFFFFPLRLVTSVWSMCFYFTPIKMFLHLPSSPPKGWQNVTELFFLQRGSSTISPQLICKHSHFPLKIVREELLNVILFWHSHIWGCCYPNCTQEPKNWAWREGKSGYLRVWTISLSIDSNL